MGLTACDDHGRLAANTKICANFQPASGQAAAPALSDAAAPVDECLRRWAYSLASSRDTADVVADATVSACGSALTRWSQAALAQPQGGEGLSLTTGQPTNPLAEHSAFARGRAVFYVVQARAGHCAPPPAANGAPTGVPTS